MARTLALPHTQAYAEISKTAREAGILHTTSVSRAAYTLRDRVYKKIAAHTKQR